MKKAKIIPDKEDVMILTQTSKNEEYYFYGSLTRQNNYILHWLFTKIRELKFYNYEIEFENRDISSLPKNAY